MFLLFTFVLSLFHLDTIDTTFYILCLPYFSNRVFCVVLFSLLPLFLLLFFILVHSLSFCFLSFFLSFIFASSLSLSFFYIIILFFLILPFLCCFTLVFQASIVSIWLILRTSHLPVQLSVANLFKDLKAAIFLIRSVSQIKLHGLLQQQPAVTNLTFLFLLIFLYPVSDFVVHFCIISISLVHYRYYLLYFDFILFF